MHMIAAVTSHMPHCQGTVRVVGWRRGDAFPRLGKSVGVDTETELITKTMLAPPLVALGVFDPESMTCYIAEWMDAPAFMHELSLRDIEQRYFNLGYDEQVLSNEDPDKPLQVAIDQRRVVDMQIRVHLRELATLGYIRGNLYSLADCSTALLNCTLDKGDGSETSTRMSFRRSVPLTQEQAQYLALDCITTWALGAVVQPQPTEIEHSQGAVVLHRITSNGMCVDLRMFRYFKHELNKARDRYRQELLRYSFPDPYADAADDAKVVRSTFHAQYQRLLALGGFTSGLHAADEDDDRNMPAKCSLRYIILYLYAHSSEPEEIKQLAENVKTVAEWDRTTLRKREADLYDTLCEDHGIQAVDQCTRAIAIQAFVSRLLQLACDGVEQSGQYVFEDIVQSALAYIDEKPEWLAPEPKIGPRKFFQSYVARIESNNPGLELERTEKSGEIRLTKKDTWRLEDMGIEDGFLDSYTSFNHVGKYLTTYMKDDFIAADGKMHPRYTSLMRTGRTSSNAPNAQNFPSRDDEFPLKTIFVPPPGKIMCATDYSFVELCAFGQACYTRYGFSVMRDVINAGLDPHRWFAGVMNKVITPDLTHAHDAQWVSELSAFLDEHVTKAQRYLAKMANFGLPGGMGARMFYQHCREGGLKVTREETDFMREAWLSTFKEMSRHMNPEVAVSNMPLRHFGMRDDEDENEELDGDEKPRQLFIARCINGFVRNRASRNAACNAQFQALVAYGAKIAGWNMVYKGGLEDNFIAFVHDEYLYWADPDKLDSQIPEVERLMLEGMAVAIPDVKVSVETSCMLHWDKSAVEFHKLKKDENGRYIIEECEFVKQAYGKLP